MVYVLPLVTNEGARSILCVFIATNTSPLCRRLLPGFLTNTAHNIYYVKYDIR